MLFAGVFWGIKGLILRAESIILKIKHLYKGLLLSGSMCLGSFLFTSCFAMKGNYVLIVIFLLFTVVSSERKVICVLSCFLLLFSSVVLWTVGEILNRKKIKFTEHTVPITILWIIIFRNILDSLSYSLLNCTELSVNLMCTYFLFGHSD